MLSYIICLFCINHDIEEKLVLSLPLCDSCLAKPEFREIALMEIPFHYHSIIIIDFCDRSKFLLDL